MPGAEAVILGEYIFSEVCVGLCQGSVPETLTSIDRRIFFTEAGHFLPL